MDEQRGDLGFGQLLSSHGIASLGQLAWTADWHMQCRRCADG
jgi:hypothetical protein